MSVFDAYSRYYDCLYRDKDYDAEAEYVRACLRRFGSDVRTILELGCGTGLHAIALAKRGYCVTGVDLSPVMLEAAGARIAAAPRALRDAVTVERGDARTYRCGRKFDAVASLFHVASYQADQRDITGFLDSAAAHLEPGGVFIFDFWYGPAVVSAEPQVRVKRFADATTRITRVCEPRWLVNEDRVDVDYEIRVEDVATGATETIRETHAMRYFFMPELRRLLEFAGFRVLHAEEWLTGREPGLDTWGVCVIASR